MDLAAILAALQVINATLPTATGFILSLTNEDGTVTPLNVLAEKSLDNTDATVAQGLAEAEAFLKRNKT